jgi:hypothetical protein
LPREITVAAKFSSSNCFLEKAQFASSNWWAIERDWKRHSDPVSRFEVGFNLLSGRRIQPLHIPPELHWRQASRIGSAVDILVAIVLIAKMPANDRKRSAAVTASADSQSSGRDIDWRVCLAVAVVFAVFCPWAMDLREGCNFWFSDGQSWAELFRYHAAQSGYLSFSRADPFQGMFDAPPSSYRGFFLVELLSSRWFGGTYRVPLLISSISLLLGGACFAAARAIELRRSTALVAALAVPMALQTFLRCHGSIDWLYALSPQAAYMGALPLLIVALYRPIVTLCSPATWACAAGIAGVALLPFFEQALSAVLMAPITVCLGVATLAASRSQREIFAKIVVAALVILVFLVIGMLPYLASLGRYIDYAFFFFDLNNFQATGAPTLRDAWHDFMFIVLGVNPSAVYVRWITPDSVAGTVGWISALVIAASPGRRTTRIFAATTAAYPVLLFGAYFIIHYAIALFGWMYPAPNPYYFKPLLHPWLLLFQLELGLRIASFIARPLLRRLRQATVPVPPARPLVAMAALSILLALGVVQTLRHAAFRTDSDVITVLKNHRYASAFQPGRGLHEYKTNAIVDLLRDQISLSPGKRFSGFVATFAPYRKSFKRCGNYDRSDWMDVNWDLPGRVINTGLWHYDIPTFYQNSATRTPQFYFVTAALLVASGDSTTRSWLVLSKPDPKILRLFGVSYVISDRILPLGTPVVAPRIPNSGQPSNCADARLDRYYLYHLDHANLGNYSPTVTEVSKDAADAVRKMRQPAFDGQDKVLTDRPMGRGFVPARTASMFYEDGGLRVEALTDSESLLVLPAQYSNCWQAIGNDAGKVELFRANVIQLGLRFRGSIAIRLELRHGPFWRHACRYADAADMRRLHVDQAELNALRWKFTPGFVPGDGRNLIFQSERLDKVMPINQSASMTMLTQCCGQLSEYLVAARGDAGEHYIGPYSTAIEPGPYTLSLQVRRGDTRWLRLQLLDASNNGAVADYDLSNEIVWLTRLPADRKAYGSIEKAEGWWKLSLSSTLQKPEARLMIQLQTKNGASYFTPGDEAVRFRALQLERGLSASIYQPDPPRSPPER